MKKEIKRRKFRLAGEFLFPRSGSGVATPHRAGVQWHLRIMIQRPSPARPCPKKNKCFGPPFLRARSAADGDSRGVRTLAVGLQTSGRSNRSSPHLVGLSPGRVPKECRVLDEGERLRALPPSWPLLSTTSALPFE